VALVFDPESTQIDVLTREQPHVEQYPELETILTGIGCNCTEDGIGVDQLRGITFFEEVSHCGGPAPRLQVLVSAFSRPAGVILSPTQGRALEQHLERTRTVRERARIEGESIPHLCPRRGEGRAKIAGMPTQRHGQG